MRGRNAMATDHESSETEERLGPQTPAARRRARSEPPGEVERELSELEGSPPEDAAVRRVQAEAIRMLVAPPLRTGRPLAEPPPAEPALEAPPVEAPPVEAPPVEEPPVEGPPAEAPPAEPPPPRAPAREPAERDPAQLSSLVVLASALGVLLALLASTGSRELPLPGLTSFAAAPTAKVLAPGGRLELTGAGVPAGTPLVLETRSQEGDWRSAGEVDSGADGRFRLQGRVVARPGQLMVRARAAGLATSDPVPVTVRPLRLASVGDINLGDTPGVMIGSDGPRYPWASSGRRLRMADIAFGNLECAVSKRGSAFPKQFNFRGTPAALAGLRRHAGIDVLNLANNHVGDYGPRATLDTVANVERLGMRAVGAGADLRRALRPQVIERLGLRVAFVGFSEIYPIEFAAAEGQPGTAWATPENVTAAVHAARDRADLVVATFHWGIEKAPVQSAQQEALAQAAAGAGANLVLGAHPHVLQPVRREGSALVAYSLGNFVFGAASSDTTATGILETDVTAEGVAEARWRPGTISGSRPLMDRVEPRPVPLDDAALAAGVAL